MKTLDDPKTCPCGSGKIPWWRYDWRTNITTWICETCTKHGIPKKRSMNLGR